MSNSVTGPGVVRTQVMPGVRPVPATAGDPIARAQGGGLAGWSPSKLPPMPGLPAKPAPLPAAPKLTAQPATPPRPVAPAPGNPYPTTAAPLKASEIAANQIAITGANNDVDDALARQLQVTKQYGEAGTWLRGQLAANSHNANQLYQGGAMDLGGSGMGFSPGAIGGLDQEVATRKTGDDAQARNTGLQQTTSAQDYLNRAYKAQADTQAQIDLQNGLSGADIARLIRGVR